MEANCVAIAGILGTLAGTLIGAGVTLRVERLRWQREDRQRFLAERRAAYVALLHHSFNAHVYFITQDAQPFDAAIRRVNEAQWEARVVASEAVHVAANRLALATARLAPFDEGDQQAKSADWIAAHKAFEEIVRRDIRPPLQNGEAD